MYRFNNMVVLQQQYDPVTFYNEQSINISKLSDQTGNGGKFLQTDGSAASWVVNGDGIYSGSGTIPDGTVATAAGDWLFTRTIDGVTFNFALDILGLVPYARIYTFDPTYGNSAVGVANNITGGSPLFAIVGVNNVADTEEAFIRSSYTTATNLYKSACTVTAIGSNNSEILMSTTSVNGDSDINIKAETSGSGTASIIFFANRYAITLTAYADDTAAGVGGLVEGDLYETTGTASAPLNVAGIVMAKQ